MLRSLRRMTISGFAMIALGVIPASVPQLIGTANQIFGSEPLITYAALMNQYAHPTPPPPASTHPGMTDAEYAAWMALYAHPAPLPPPPPPASIHPGMTDAEYAAWMALYAQFGP